MSEKILAAYYYSCLGEFHEGASKKMRDRVLFSFAYSVTVARAMNAKQDNALISSISNQISQYFDMGGKDEGKFNLGRYAKFDESHL